MKPAASACVLGLAVLSASAAAVAQPVRYAASMEHELQQLGIEARCSAEATARHHCTYTRPSPTGDGVLAMHAVYSDESDTIYFYVERLLVVPSDHPQASSVLRRLMELNWELLVGRFEWNPRTGEVRLGAILNTDSNFDRRAFRSIVRALDALTLRYLAELRGLLAP
jgi:hypothetical protein